jgi:hypothetical protein
VPILSHSSRHSLSHRLAVGVIYPLLTVMGITMVVPFLITLTLSVSNAYDYQRFSVVPRYFYSDEDRFVKYLTGYFNDYSGWQAQMALISPMSRKRGRVGRISAVIGKVPTVWRTTIFTHLTGNGI